MDSLKGTQRLIRLSLRRDRIVIPVTLLLSVGMVAGSAPALSEAYNTYEKQLSYITSSVSSAVGRMFQGTIQGVNIGQILTAETFMFTAVILAIMSIFIVTRHTRHNEESGAAELIGSMNVGRNSPLTAALLVAVGANLLAGGLMFVLLSIQSDFDTTGTFYFSASLAMGGIFFAGVAAITAQLSDFRRGSNMMAIAALILAFIVRAVGDALGSINPDGLGVSTTWISWISPLGWVNQTLPYAENNPFPLVLLLVGFLVCVITGFILLNHRDIGSSIIASRPGPARAKPSLLTPSGLTKRLQRPGMLAWFAGAILIGGMMGVVINDFKTTFEENEAFQEFLSAQNQSGSIVEIMVASMFPILGAMLAGFVVTAMSKMQDEEGRGRLEFLISTALSRTKWFLTHIYITAIGITILLGSLGIVGAIGYTISSNNPEVPFGEIVLAGMSSIPAMFLFTSIILIVFALFGRFVKTFAWSFFAYCVLIGSFAGIFKWPQWTINFSPFTHTPAYPSESFEAFPLIFMFMLSIIISIISVSLFNRRDLSLK